MEYAGCCARNRHVEAGMRSLAFTAAVAAIVSTASLALGDDEIALFDGAGQPVAYIAPDDDLTIYLWNGHPVAYLSKDSPVDGFNVYGLNGHHLGWFSRGAIWDHSGNASCAIKE